MRRDRKLYIVQSVTDLNGTPKTEYPYEGLHGFLGHIPFIGEGCLMEIQYPDDDYVRLTTTRVREYDYDKRSQIHTIRTKNSIYKIKDGYDKKARKRAKAHLYMRSPIGRRWGQPNPDPEFHLLSSGIYRTKIHEQDLPEWYVFGYMYKAHGYMSAKGVKHLVYRPNYLFNHLYKDDILFVSYGSEITPIEEDRGRTWYEGYDEILSGPVIVEFAEAVGKYSDIDVTEILSEMEKKEVWYRENYESWDRG